MSVYKEYIKVIGESVPLMMIPEEWSEEQIQQALQKCINERKPFNIADYDSTHNSRKKY